MLIQGWDGRPENPDIRGWYWLVRQEGPNLRHAAWYWCNECHRWEAEPDLSFSAQAVARDGWQVLSLTSPPTEPIEPN
jgi:hypothetical protein